MNFINKTSGKILKKVKNLSNHLITKYEMSMFESYGKNVYIGDDLRVAGNENISIGNNVYVGPHAMLMTTNSKIKLGNNIMFGPNVTIITGNHRIDVVGEYMFNVKEKLPENDQEVIIEDDVWIGANATILKGVTIGRGSVVGACSLVTKSIPPYTIYSGTPSARTKSRFDDETINRHEQLLLTKNNTQYL